MANPAKSDRLLAHEYRAFFDVADLLNMTLREKICKALSGYSIESIQAILPAYYKEMRPKIEEICVQIAAVRGAKDIGEEVKIIDGVEEYRKLIDQLHDFWTKISNSLVALDEYQRKRSDETRKERRRVTRSGVLIVFLTAVITWAVTSIGGALVNSDTADAPASQPTSDR